MCGPRGAVRYTMPRAGSGGVSARWYSAADAAPSQAVYFFPCFIHSRAHLLRLGELSPGRSRVPDGLCRFGD